MVADCFCIPEQIYSRREGDQTVFTRDPGGCFPRLISEINTMNEPIYSIMSRFYVLMSRF